MASKFEYIALGTDSLYLVRSLGPGQATADCAVFRWIDASRAKPASGKNLAVHPFADAYERPDGEIDVERLLAILRFCFESVIELTSNLSHSHVCKIYCSDPVVYFVYRAFADELQKTGLYRVSFYRQWIEIRLQDQSIYKQFWTRLRPLLNAQSDRYPDISLKDKTSWLLVRPVATGVNLCLATNTKTTKHKARAVLCLERGRKEESQVIYDGLASHKQQIEKDCGGSLVWEREEKWGCSIGFEVPGDMANEEQWDTMQESMIDAMVKLEKALREPLAQAVQKLEK